jgi:hypothetical protein
VSWQNFTDTRCESSNPSSTGGGSFSWTKCQEVFGPNYEDLLDRLKVVAGNLFRARGETVTEVEIAPSEKPALHVLH